MPVRRRVSRALVVALGVLALVALAVIGQMATTAGAPSAQAAGSADASELDKVKVTPGVCAVAQPSRTIAFTAAQGFTSTSDFSERGEDRGPNLVWRGPDGDTDYSTKTPPSDYYTVETRLKPGTTDTVQMIVRYLGRKQYHYMVMSNTLNWAETPRLMLMSPVSGNGATTIPGVDLDAAAQWYDAHTSDAYDPSFDPGLGTGFVTARMAVHGSFTSGTSHNYSAWGGPSGDYLYYNKNDYEYFRSDGATTGYLSRIPANTVDSQHIVAWYSDTNDDDTWQAMYAEFRLNTGSWQQPQVYLAFAQRGAWGGTNAGYPTPSVKVQVSDYKPQNLAFQGYFDSPYLDPALYGGDPDNILPKGMQLTAHIQVPDGNGRVRNADHFYVQRGNECWEYTDGTIDFSGDDLATVWSKLGQDQTMKIYLDEADAAYIGDDKLNIAFDIYKDPLFTELADFTPDHTATSDRMRDGYIKTSYKGSTVPVPVKVKYYPENKCWNTDGSGCDMNPADGRPYRLRIRPYVLREADPSLPLNPVGVTPYRNLIKWMSFTDTELRAALNTGQPLSRDVIPGFITAQCKVRDYQAEETDAYTPGGWKPSTLDAWAPGDYFEDGAPWMIGDDQRIAMHQTGPSNQTHIGLDCWGERTNLNQKGDEPEVFRFPIGAFVAVDGESTDGPMQGSGQVEWLFMSVNDGTGTSGASATSKAALNPYPITGYSSCTPWAVDQLRTHGDLPRTSLITSVKGATRATTYDGPDKKGYEGIQFFNPDGRCGEKNSGTWGAMFGPALMLVAPSSFDVSAPDSVMSSAAHEVATGDDTADINSVKKSVTISMKGLGKEAIGFGLIMGGDTSNADYNAYMPPAYQLSSLSFNGGLTDNEAKVDWTDPSNYNQNYFYYGSRLGKKAVAYSPYSGGLQVKDGSRNDSQPAHTVSVQLGNDTEPRTQPKIDPVDQTEAEHRAYTSDQPGTWLVGQDAQLLTVGDDGARLTSAPRVTEPLTVTIACGQAYSPNGENLTAGTAVRAWADFNGNGVFDPDEASSVGTCDKQNGQTSQLRSAEQMKQPTGDMPWTNTTAVTVTFDYPTEHDLNGKRNVWMRLRAVAGTDKDYLAGEQANERATATATAYEGLAARTVNPDADAPASTLGSAYGAWTYTPSGETEDFLFDITPPATAADDLMCLPQGQDKVTVAVLPNDDAALKALDDPDGSGTTPARTADPSSVVFLAGQDGVVVTEGGKKASVAGEGTYAVEQDGSISFTASDELKEKMRALTADSAPIALTGVRYAFTTATGEKVYDRAAAASAAVYGTAQFACGVQARAVMGLDQAGSYEWDLGKTVLKGDDAASASSPESWVKEDERQRGTHTGAEQVGLTYRLTVTARPAELKRTGIRGSVLVLNPTNQPVSTASLSLAVSGENAGDLVCRPDSDASVEVPAGKTASVGFTCTSPSGTYPADGVTVTPTVTLSGSGSAASVAADRFDPAVGTTSKVAHESVRLTDLLTGDGVTTEDGQTGTDLTGRSVTEVSADGGEGKDRGALSGVVLHGSELAPQAGKSGSVTLQMKAGDLAPHYLDEGDQVLTNTVTLCDAAASDCGKVPAFEGAASRDEDGTVKPATAVVTIKGQEPTVPIWILKTGVADDGSAGQEPLDGSQFALFHDADGKVGEAVEGAPAAVSGQEPDTPEGAKDAQFVFHGAVRGQTYWLVETKAPAGHQLLAQPVQVKVADDGSVSLGEGESGFVTVRALRQDPADGALVTVSDVEGAHLPAFGGPGVWLLTALGALVVLAAWMVRRRRSPQADSLAPALGGRGRHAA